MSTVLTDEQTTANIAANVRRLRGDTSKYSLAKLCGTSTIHITRIERGDHMPSSGLLARLAEALETTADALLSLDATKKSKNRG